MAAKQIAKFVHRILNDPWGLDNPWHACALLGCTCHLKPPPIKRQTPYFHKVNPLSAKRKSGLNHGSSATEPGAALGSP
jgi:hypothetical protein